MVNRLDITEGINRLQAKMNSYKERDSNSFYNQGYISGLEYALDLLEAIQQDQQATERQARLHQELAEKRQAREQSDPIEALNAMAEQLEQIEKELDSKQ